MTVKRDESRDVGVHEDFYAPRPWKEVVEDYRFERYVPHSQYAALEALAASQSASLAAMSTELGMVKNSMLALREFVEDIASMRLDHLEDLDGSVLCRAQDLIEKVTR